MKIRAEYKALRSDMISKDYSNWCKHHVVAIIMDSLIKEGLIEFTETYKDGYCIIFGEVLCENPKRAEENGEWMLRLEKRG